MVELGEKSKKDPAAEALVSSLLRGSPYAQLLSLKTCHGSRDVGVAIQLLSANSRYMKKQAINLIASLGSDAELLEALKSAPTYLQRQTISRIRSSSHRRKRPKVIDEFLELLAKEGERSLFQRLLPFGSKATLEKYLPTVIDGFALVDWSFLAKYHPDIAQQKLYRLIEKSEDRDAVLVSTVQHVFTRWISHDSTVDFALELVRKSLEKMPLSKFPIGFPDPRMLKRCPRQTIDIIISSNDDIDLVVFGFQERKLFKKLPLSQFLGLIKRYPKLIEGAFDKLTPEQRLPVYEIIREAWRDEDGVLEWDVPKYLPTKERVQEARRTLKLKVFETKPSDLIRHISWLPWEEAMALQTPFLRSSESEVRSSALQWQIKAAKYDSAHIEDALDLILAHKNEPGTVQREMFRSLGEVPVARFKEHHLALLTQIVRNGLDSADAVYAMQGMISVVADMLSVNPRWAAQRMALIIREQGTIPSRVQLSGVVPVKEVMAIVEKEMSPVLESLLRKQDGASLCTLAAAFVTYIEYWPELRKTCTKTLEIQEMGEYHEIMMEMVYKFKQPSGFWARIIPLLTKENRPIAGSRRIIKRIHLQLQNLLDPYLHPIPAPPSYTRKRNALNTLKGGFWRWTPSQQDALVQIILKDIADQDVTSKKKVSYVKQLGLLPSVDPKYLIQLASDERPIIQEAALKALGRMDGAQGVPALIDTLGDDRGRIAIYALRSVLKMMSKSETFTLLKAVPETKVTVAKEKVRLIGDLETDEALQWLLQAEKTKLHASVRKALLRALWPYLTHFETWEIFHRAAADPEPDTAKGVISIPSNGMAFPTRQKHLHLLLQLLNHPLPEVRLAALQRCNSMPLQDPANILSSRLFELIHSPYDDECSAATKAIFATYAKNQVDLIEDLYEGLIKDRKLLIRVHDKPFFRYISPCDDMKHLRPVTHRILSILKKDRFSVTRRVRLMFNGLPWEEIKPHLLEIVPELTADALCVAKEEIEGAWGAWKRTTDDFTEGELEFAGSKDERGRRLAVSLLVGSVGVSGAWTREKKERLEVYRGDESVLVAEAAWEVELRGEGDEEEDEEGSEK